MFKIEIGQIGIPECPNRAIPGIGPSVQTKVDSESTNPNPGQNNHIKNS